jgi:hypothetical protein
MQGSESENVVSPFHSAFALWEIPHPNSWFRFWLSNYYRLVDSVLMVVADTLFVKAGQIVVFFDPLSSVSAESRRLGSLFFTIDDH